MCDLDELLWSSRGDGTALCAEDWQRILDHTFGKLAEFFRVPLRMRYDPLVENGFHAGFESAESTNDPLQLRLRGWYGVDFPGRAYACVQGFVYVYNAGQRLVTLNGKNHIYIRYARIDADNDNWDMTDCTGPSAWRSYGWSVDEYGEFQGDEVW